MCVNVCVCVCVCVCARVSKLTCIDAACLYGVLQSTFQSEKYSALRTTLGMRMHHGHGVKHTHTHPWGTVPKLSQTSGILFTALHTHCLTHTQALTFKLKNDLPQHMFLRAGKEAPLAKRGECHTNHT